MELRAGETLIGRADSCTIVLSDERLSRLHAKISIVGGAATIVDMGSRNGTFLNDSAVKSPMRLHDGDVIRMGNTRLTVVVAKIKRRSDVQRVTLIGSETLSGAAAAASLGAGIDLLARVLQMGRIDEAEKLLKARVAYLLQADPKPAVDQPMSKGAVEALLTMTEKTMSGVWLDRMFKLHVSCGWQMTEAVQRKAEQLLRALGRADGAGLRAYVDYWGERQAELDSAGVSNLNRLVELQARG